MKEPFVADASIGLAWAVQSQSTGSTDVLRASVKQGRPWVIPALWMLETANALLVLERRKRITSQQRLRALEGITLIAPEIDELAASLAHGPISQLAAKHNLSVYDATYLELALRRGFPLASRDTALNKIAKRCGVPTLL